MVVIKIMITGCTVEHRYKTVGYADFESDYYNVISAVYFLFGIKFYKKELWREPVPSWAIFKQSTLGFCEWKSTRPLLISASNKRKIIKTISIK